MDEARREIEVNGERQIYFVDGQGPPVVLIHGLSGSSTWWLQNVTELRESFTVYGIDLPGFGAMGRGRSTFSLDDAAVWIRDWMEAVHIRPAHIIAHSLGGYIAVRLAVQFPDLVDRLVLVNPAGISDHKLAEYSLPLMRAAQRVKPRFFPVFARDFFRAGPRTILEAARRLISENIRDELPLVQQPTLVVWGITDSLIPPSIGEVFRAEIPDSELYVIDGAGHAPMIDQPEIFNSIVKRFLNGERVGT